MRVYKGVSLVISRYTAILNICSVYVSLPAILCTCVLPPILSTLSISVRLPAILSTISVYVMLYKGVCSPCVLCMTCEAQETKEPLGNITLPYNQPMPQVNITPVKQCWPNAGQRLQRWASIVPALYGHGLIREMISPWVHTLLPALYIDHSEIYWRARSPRAGYAGIGWWQGSAGSALWDRARHIRTSHTSLSSQRQTLFPDYAPSPWLLWINLLTMSRQHPKG